MCVCVCVISSQHPKTVGVDYSCIEYIKNIIYIYVSALCMVIVSSLIDLKVFNTVYIQSVYSAMRRKLKPGYVVIMTLFRQRILSYTIGLTLL